MKYLVFTLVLLFSIPLGAQEVEATNVPCKPVAKLAAHYGRLARSTQLMDIWDWDVTYYDLNFDIDIDAEIVTGSVVVQFTSLAAALEHIQLNLSSGLTVDSVYLDGAVFNHASDMLSITLAGSYANGESATVGIAYHGHPVENGFQAFEFGTQNDAPGGIPMISTLSEPYGSGTWWPCKDVPTDKADSLRVTITTADNLTAVSNGLLQSETDNGDGTKTWVWEHHYPIATYLVSLAISEYTYWDDTFHFTDGDSMLLEYWMYPSYATEANRARWNLTGNMIETYNQNYGKYPYSTEKYGMAQFGWGGAMEHQTCSSMGSSAENTIAHELSHQWWGDLVTCANFHHIWLNEGFATYSEALYWGAKNGPAAYHAHLASMDANYTGSIYRTDTTDVWSIFDYIVYGKGAWTLHMLRHVVGDDTFFDILAQYRDTYQFSSATTEDFQAVAETVWGQDLEWFFDQWIYGTGKPNYHWWWSAAPLDDANQSQVSVHIDQVQSAYHPTFKMPIDLQFSDFSTDTTLVIWDSLRAQDFTLSLDFVPNQLNFDPEVWIHKQATHVTGVRVAQQPTDFKLLDVYPNPFNAQVTIPYILANDAPGQLVIFDVQGNQIFRKILTSTDPGTYSTIWSGRDDQGQTQSSGIYFIRIQSNRSWTSARKLLLLK